MAWFNTDDKMHSHPTSRAAGLEAIGLWTLAGTYCTDYLTDGAIPESFVESWPKGKTPRSWSRPDCGRPPTTAGSSSHGPSTYAPKSRSWQPRKKPRNANRSSSKTKARTNKGIGPDHRRVNATPNAITFTNTEEA